MGTDHKLGPLHLHQRLGRIIGRVQLPQLVQGILHRNAARSSLATASEIGV